MNTQWSVGKKLTGGFGLALLMLLAIGGGAFLGLTLLVEKPHWVTHTPPGLGEPEGILSPLKDNEHRPRGIVLTDKGKKYMDKIRDIVAEMEEEEKQLLDERTKKEAATVLTAKLTILIGSLLAFIVLLVFSFVLTRGITRPLQQVMDRSQQI